MALQRATAIVAMSAMACGDAGSTANNGDSVFLAFASDFHDFRTWQSFADPSDPIATSPHLTGPRTEYLNEKPDPASKEFPVGTIIVKEIGDGDVTTRGVFAMVKRGGGYNPEGASNWEWFELVNGADGSETIRWRGVGPPLGEMYGGDPLGGCNGCHAGSRANDFVQSQKLRLGAL